MKFRRQLSRGVIRVLLGAAVCATVGCGGGSGGGGSGNGGSGGSASTDTVPPTFAGLSTATVNDDGTISLTWDPATDNDSPASGIAYAVYSANKAGGEDFSTPYMYTPSGANGAVLSGVTPGQNYFWVVRAVDQAGNEDTNSVEKSASPDDTTPPYFAGVTVVTDETSHSALVEWKLARDNASTTAQISYQVFVSTSPDPTTFDFTKPDVTAKPGEASALVTDLDPLSTYFVIVRAVDAAKNQDTNTRALSVTTPEGDAPAFAGLKQINPLSEGMKLYWLSAQDNVTDVANIVYNVYLTTNATLTAADLATPAFVTPPGAVTFIVPGLINQQRYSFIVRAQDSAGNEDTNTTTLSARALSGADTTAPSFNGNTVTVTGTSPSTLLVTWTAGSDLVTDPADLIYSVYVSSSMDPIASDATPTLVAAPGATSAIVAGLPAQATRWVTVRCSDQAGNQLANTISKSGATLAAPSTDIVPPTFTATPVVTADPSRPSGLHVSWTAGSDDTSAATKLHYLVCADPVEANCLGTDFLQHIYTSSTPPALSLDLTGLLSRTRYFVYVRAEDEAGNISAAGGFGSAATTPTSFTRDVSPIFFDKCNGCHDPSFSVLTTVSVAGGYVDTRIPATAGGLSLVEPGNPRDSLIYRRINPLGLPSAPFSQAVTNLYRGPQEPQNAQKIFAGPLSGDEDGAIRDWITQGAFAN
jgi:hypothetical protein